MLKPGDRVEILTQFGPRSEVFAEARWVPATFVDWAPELGGSPGRTVAVKRDDGEGSGIGRTYTIDAERCRPLRRGPIPEEHRALSHGALKR